MRIILLALIVSQAAFAAKTLERFTVVLTKDSDGNRQYITSYSTGTTDFPGDIVDSKSVAGDVSAGNKSAADSALDAVYTELEAEVKTAEGIP